MIRQNGKKTFAITLQEKENRKKIVQCSFQRKATFVVAYLPQINKTWIALFVLTSLMHVFKTVDFRY